VKLWARYLQQRNDQWSTKDGEAVSLPLLDGYERVKHKQVVEIIVTDTGIGLKEEDLERIFDPFVQVDGSKSRRYQGAGLGLSLTKRLVELHGGIIWAVSQGENKGSTFHVVIPMDSVE
jgi:signal transduction histidine kinase